MTPAKPITAASPQSLMSLLLAVSTTTCKNLLKSTESSQKADRANHGGAGDTGPCGCRLLQGLSRSPFQCTR